MKKLLGIVILVFLLNPFSYAGAYNLTKDEIKNLIIEYDQQLSKIYSQNFSDEEKENKILEVCNQFFSKEDSWWELNFDNNIDTKYEKLSEECKTQHLDLMKQLSNKLDAVRDKADIYDISDKTRLKKILEICEDFENANIQYNWFSQVKLNQGIGFDRYCGKIREKSAITADAEFALIKELDIKKFNLKYFKSKTFELDFSKFEPDFNKCIIDLETVKSIDYKKILQTCNVKKFYTNEYTTYGKQGFEETEWSASSDLSSRWIIILDHYYADVNKDNYLDLVIKILAEGSYSGPSTAHEIIITSKTKGIFKILE